MPKFKIETRVVIKENGVKGVVREIRLDHLQQYRVWGFIGNQFVWGWFNEQEIELDEEVYSDATI